MSSNQQVNGYSWFEEAGPSRELHGATCATNPHSGSVSGCGKRDASRQNAGIARIRAWGLFMPLFLELFRKPWPLSPCLVPIFPCRL